MLRKDADGMTNGVDPDQTATLGLIWVFTVRQDLSVGKFRIITVVQLER